jgi:hypothetical protein
MKREISGRRIAFFVVVCVVVITWVAAGEGEHASMARHFLRGLLRALF